jgi:ankyrin repeat protein
VTIPPIVSIERAGIGFAGGTLVSAIPTGIAGDTQIIPAARVRAAYFTQLVLMLSRYPDNQNNAGALVAGNYDARMNSANRRTSLRFWFCILGIGISLHSTHFAVAQSRPSGADVEAFFTAIQMGDTNAATAMLESKTNLAFVGENFSKLPLLEAAAAGNVVLVKRLLQLGADINASGDTRMSAGSQMTALHEAISHNQPAVCKLLLEAGADPNVMAFSFSTPLHLAFSENREEMAGWLLDYGAEPFQGKLFSNDETTPFELDVTRSSGKLVARMLGQDSKHPLGTKSLQKPRHSKQPRRGVKSSAEVLSQHGNELLTAAAQRGELEAVQALLLAGVSARSGNTNCPTLLQSFSLVANNNAKNIASATDQWHRLQDQLKADYISKADASFVASLRSQEANQAGKVAMMAPERWQKILEVLMQHGADYDAFAATALDDTNQVKALVSADKNVVRARDCSGQTPLQWAIQTDEPQMVSFWINAGTPLGVTNSSGQTALHIAAANGKTEFVKALLAAHAPTGIRDTNGWTPLDAAIQAKQSDCIHLLLAGKAASAHPERGLTLTLHEAAATGNIAALAALLETETNLEARNELGLTPLQVAVSKGHLAAAALLVDKGANLNVRDPDGNSLLHQIFLQDRFTVYDRPPTNWLAGLKAGPHKDEFIKYLTVGQYEQGPNPVLQGTSFLLACGLDAQATNHAGQTVMQLVTDEKISRSVFFFDDDREKLIKLLSSAGGNVDQRDAEGNTALHRLANAVDANEVDRMKSLIAGGANVNATNHLGQTPLHKAAERIWGWDNNEDGDNEPFQLLVKSGANVNARDNQGRTPLDVLMSADSSFKEQATALLIKAGAKPNQSDPEGMTPLHRVTASGDAFTSGTVQSLLDSGANPNARDAQGRTPVHLLLTGEWPWRSAGDNLQKLADSGADFSAKDNNGKTPLHYLAALGGKSPLFFIRGIDQIFVNAKVDFNARDNDGDTPLHIAAKNGTRDVFDWLVKHGAGLDDTNHAGETPRLLSAHSSNSFPHAGPPNADADTDIFTAAREGKLEPLAALIKADPSLANTTNQFGQTPLRVAVMARRTNAVEFLVQHDARWDIVSAVMFGQTNALLEILARPSAGLAVKNDSSLLYLAAANGDVETTKILLNAGGDLQAQDNRGLSPLGAARLQHQAAVAEILRQHGATENIFDAAYNHQSEIAARLIARDKSLALATNYSGVSVLEIATGLGQADLLQLLFENEASAKSVNARDGRTPLHFAAIYNQTDTARLLIRRGAKVDAYDQQGFTPLHLAAVCGAMDVAALLIKNHADPDKVTTNSSPDPIARMSMMHGRAPLILPGDSALHLAAVFGQTNLIQLLLASRASVNATDSVGRTALDLATQANFPPVTFMIHRQIGRMNPLGISEPSPFFGLQIQLMQERQKVIASLLEKAGGQRGKAREVNQGFGRPPGF